MDKQALVTKLEMYNRFRWSDELAMGRRAGPSKATRGRMADRVLDRIHARAWVYLNLPSPQDCDLQEIDPLGIGSTGKSRLFKLGAKGISRKLFVKTYEVREGERLRRAYEAEVKALTELGNLFGGDPRFRMPRLLDSWEDLTTVVVEGVDGVPVWEVVRRNSKMSGSARDRVKKSSELFHSIGGWLAHMHNVTYAGDEFVGVERVVELNARLERALANRKLSEDRVGRRIMKSCRRLLDIVEGNCKALKVPIARRHGDFSLGNLMIGVEREVIGIDACGGQLEPVYIEVAHFMATLGTGRRRVAWGRALRALERSFLTGYMRGAKFPLVGRRIGLRIYRVYAYLRLCAQTLERWEARGSIGWGGYVEREWIRVNYLWPIEALTGRAEQMVKASHRGGNSPLPDHFPVRESGTI